MKKILVISLVVMSAFGLFLGLSQRAVVEAADVQVLSM